MCDTMNWVMNREQNLEKAKTRISAGESWVFEGLAGVVRMVTSQVIYDRIRRIALSGCSDLAKHDLSILANMPLSHDVAT